MMKLVILLAATFMVNQITFATEQVRPWARVIAWSYGVDLTINNYSDEDYRCSGPIHIRYENGGSDVEYYSGIVRARSSEHRYFYSRRSGRRIQTAYESIFCYKN